MEKVSVIIPLYNGEKYIEQTISNILNSTYQNIEIIIVNDGSKDNGVSICEQMGQRDPRLFIYSKKNGGVDSTRNYGIAKATGEYLVFCDQDDIVQCEMYARMVESITKNQSDLCMCSTARSIDGKVSVFETSEDRCYEGEEILEELLYPMLFNGYNIPLKVSPAKRYPHIWSCMFRRSFIDENDIRFRTYINYEDDLLVKIEALSKAVRVSTVSYVGYYWRVNLKSETYAHKFVDNIGKKQQQSYEDMLGSISYRISDKRALELFKQVTFCRHYVDAVHNIASPFVKKDYAFIKEYYRHEIYERDFTHCIKARKYLKRGRVKQAVLLPLLKKKMTLVSYWAEKILDHILLITLHSQTLTKLERKMKKD